MEPFVFGILGALAGYLSGNLHSKCIKSECCWGCCQVEGLENDVNFSKEKTNPMLNNTNECNRDHNNII